MDLLVFVLAVLSYLYDGAKDLFAWVFSPWVMGITFVTLSFSFLRMHLDSRFDAIERRLDALQHPDYE